MDFKGKNQLPDFFGDFHFDILLIVLMICQKNICSFDFGGLDLGVLILGVWILEFWFWGFGSWSFDFGGAVCTWCFKTWGWENNFRPLVLNVFLWHCMSSLSRLLYSNQHPPTFSLEVVPLQWTVLPSCTHNWRRCHDSFGKRAVLETKIPSEAGKHGFWYIYIHLWYVFMFCTHKRQWLSMVWTCFGCCVIRIRSKNLEDQHKIGGKSLLKT